MKKLAQILENNSEVTGLQAKPLLIDNTGLVLSYLEQISEMADEIYNTLADLPEIDREVHTLIQNVYTNLDDAYEIVDNKYDIEPIDDLDEIEESFENELSEESKTVELVYKDLAKMNNTALLGILRKMNHPDFNNIKNQGKEDIISEILMFKFGEEKALKFLENPNNFKLREAKSFVSKGIYTLDGKKIEGARSSKLFLQALDTDGFLHDLSWKEWSESNLNDTSSDSAKKQFVDRLAKQIKMFNKKVNLNTWIKGGNRSFVDTVNYIFKLDPNIKYSKAAGLKEDVELDEMKSPQQKFDMKRVNSGAMSRDEYNKKYKLGKYTPPQQKFDMKRVNSGAMSRDEYNKKYKLASAAPKSESIESEIFEEVDISRLKQLALTGLVSKEDTPKLVNAMRTLENNKQLSVVQRDLIIGTFLSLIGIVTGDSALFNKVKQSV